MYTEKEIIRDLKNILGDSTRFFKKENGDLTMSLDGEYVDHTWASGTFTDQDFAPSSFKKEKKEREAITKWINNN